MESPIDAYIAEQAEEARPYLLEMRTAIRQALPDAEEKIAWGMPTWHQGRNLIHMGAAKHHISIYPGAEAVEAFAPEFDRLGLGYSKGAIRVPYEEPLPLSLVFRIATWCLEQAR